VSGNHNQKQKEQVMDKGLNDAFTVIDLWIRAVLGALEATVYLPFKFLGALFD